MVLHPLTEQYISKRLAEAQSSPPGELYTSVISSDETRPAAVLIPLFHANLEDEKKHNWQVLLTRRTDAVAEHQGQVAFPGGRAESADISPESTALREAQEEIGLDPTRVRILGRMNRYQTITNYCVTPVVGVIPWPFPVRLEEIEVSRVFSIPLDWLADPNHHEIRDHPVPLPYSKLLHRETHPVIYFQRYANELLWGVSAQIMLNFINILAGKKV